MSKTYYDSFKDTFSSLFYSQGTDSFFGSKGYTTQRAFNYNKPSKIYNFIIYSAGCCYEW